MFMTRTGTRFLRGISYRFYQQQATALNGIPPPLQGIKVVDLTRVLAGPTATMLLADLGADVVKVEEVTRGDDTRQWDPPSAPTIKGAPEVAKHLPAESAYFLAANKNKRSMTVNFKKPEGLKIIHKMIAQADILVENYIPGKLASMGLGYEDCKAINPGLIYASITGYGQTGPYSQAPGYDVIIAGEGGLMHITGEPDGPPCKVGVASTDIATGLYAHGAIMAALISRQRTGKGVWVDCSLFDTQLAGLANVASNYLIAGHEGGRHGTAHPSIVPYQAFPCKDGFLMFGTGNERQFKTLATRILEQPALADDPRFSSNAARVANRTELIKIISDVLTTNTRDYWIEKFTGLGIPFGPINNVRQAFEHPQAKARHAAVEVDHPRAGKIKVVAPAVFYDGKKMPVRRPPPWLSQHTTEILEELGYSLKEIEELKEGQVVPTAHAPYKIPVGMESTQKRRISSPPAKASPTSEVKSLPVDIADAPSPAPGAEPESPVGEDDLADDETDDGDVNIPSDIIDKEIFNQILDLDDGDTKEFSFEMTAAYLVQAKETFTSMDRALVAKDLHELSRLGHYLKGSSAAIGIKKVQASCEMIQHCGDDALGESKLVQAEALQKIAEMVSQAKKDNEKAEAWLHVYYKDEMEATL
ncbi:CoA-transferase III family protein [Pleurotus pulmonarius]